MFCPYCGSQDIHTDLTDWTFQSVEDPTNTGTIPENQCDACGAAFWCDPVEGSERIGDCGACGADIGPSDSFPWHYPDEDCRAIRTPKA